MLKLLAVLLVILEFRPNFDFFSSKMGLNFHYLSTCYKWDGYGQLKTAAMFFLNATEAIGSPIWFQFIAVWFNEIRTNLKNINCLLFAFISVTM